MKNAKKIMLLVLCAALLVGATVAGTVAYLTSQDTVTNTFTVGEVAITLDETKVDEYGVPVQGEDPVKTNVYKLIPGHTYTKDPTIHVDAESEKCWLFAKIENGLGDDAEIKMVTDWTNIAGTNFWVYNAIVDADADVTVFTEFTYTDEPTEIPEAHKAANITVTAYAIQSDGFSTSAEAWTALDAQLSNP